MPKEYAAGDQLNAADYNPVVKVSGGYATDAGGDDTYEITVTPTPGSYADGDEYTFKPATANTGACTLNVNSLGAKSLKKFTSNGKADLITGDILANQPVRVKYDGTDFIVMSLLAQFITRAAGESSRDMTAASGQQTIAHGLGTTPARVVLHLFWGVNNASGGGISVSTAIIVGGTTRKGYATTGVDESGSGGANGASFLAGNTTTSGTQTGVVTADSTNIIIDWTKAGSPTGTATIVWEAEI